MEDNDTQPTTETWLPGKGKIQVNLSGTLAKFQAVAWAELEGAFAAASDVQELLALLSNAGWETLETEWKEITFDNRFRAYPVSATEQLRLIVSLSSKKRLTVGLHTWYRN